MDVRINVEIQLLTQGLVSKSTMNTNNLDDINQHQAKASPIKGNTSKPYDEGKGKRAAKRLNQRHKWLKTQMFAAAMSTKDIMEDACMASKHDK